MSLAKSIHPEIALAPQPTREINTGRCVIRMYGTATGDWGMPPSPSALQGRYDVYEDVTRNRVVLARLSELAQRHGLSRVVCPSPHLFNTKTACCNDERWKLVVSVPVPVFRGQLVDAVHIDTVTMFAIASAGCPTVVMYNQNDEGTPVVGHAGRDCLFNRNLINGKRSSCLDRPWNSVLEGMRRAVPTQKTSSIVVYIVCGVCNPHFSHPHDHPTHGEFNKRLTEDLITRYGEQVIMGDPTQCAIHMPNLIRAQCVNLHIPNDSIHWDEVDTYGEMDGDHYVWHDNRRDPGPRRNLVTVSCA